MVAGLLIGPAWGAAPTQSSFTADDVTLAQQFGAQLDLAEWLGPLAPVALSPFFGVTCLSGLALLGSDWGRDLGLDWIDPDNPLLGEGSPLANGTLFAVFLGLTLLTSLPRLTKVSKPFAQGVDQLETWSVIVTLVAFKLATGLGGDADEPVALYEAGLLSVPLDLALGAAAALNVFVINSVKFFFEVLVWLTPLPFLDAAFEAANKGVAAGLMAVYAWSPMAATVINLALFAVCLLVFRWMHRRQVYYRKLLWGLVLGAVSKWKRPAPIKITVFPRQEFGPFEDRARLRFRAVDSGWRLEQKRLFGERHVEALDRERYAIRLERGLIAHSLELRERDGEGRASLQFSRRHDAVLEELARGLCVEFDAGPAPASRAGDLGRRAELA